MRPEGREGKPRLETLDRGRHAPLGEKPQTQWADIILRPQAVKAQITEPYLNTRLHSGRSENIMLPHAAVSKGSSYLLQEITVLDKVCHQVFKKA